MRLSILILPLALSFPLPSHANAPLAGPLRVVAAPAASGLEQELLAAFARTLGRPIETAPAPSAEVALEAVRAGSADVAAGVLAAQPGFGALAVSREVFPSRLVAVTRRPSASADAIEGLRGKTLGVLRGSRAPAAVHDAKISGAEIVEGADLAAALGDLREGKVAALLLELPEALAARRRDPALQLGVFLGTRQSLVCAVRPADRPLLGQLDQYLGSVRSTSSWAVIITRAFGPDALEVLSRARLGD